ncbi:MAG: tryptophan--tRNA ligase [Microbacteriaceae bacterium]|nr:tryptophan--tRNA ligase [Microbacteriaceae bacterium]
MTTKQVIFSGMQPSDDSLHLGNYLGALVSWRNLQNKYDSYFCVVDMHALTSKFDPAELASRTRQTAAQYIAAGVDPEKATLFVQSNVPAHAELAWVLNTLTGFGEASRMTQFKDKSQRFGNDGTTVGLFTYPMLMAADILLYQTNLVPVGDDQKQHLELSRTLAERFNSRFGDTFAVPDIWVPESSARVYDLQEPTAKMSKSAESDAGLIRIMDDPAITAKKIRRAVTDNDALIKFDPQNKPGVSNLLAIISTLAEESIQQTQDRLAGLGYGDLKKEVEERVMAEIIPVRERTMELLAGSELDDMLSAGATKAANVASETLAQVYDKIGFYRQS